MTLNGSEPRELAIPLLVEAHAGRLHSLGLRFCGSGDEAQDMVQETFLQAYRAWDQFEGRAKASTWLYMIATRVCQRFHRKRVGEPDHLEPLDELLPFGKASMGVVPESEDGPLGEVIRKEGREQIEAAIVALPTIFRMPLVLKEIVGFSVAEVAAILDLKEQTVKTRLHRARLRLRKALESALPKREVPPPAYSKQVCLDLLAAKQESLDHGSTFEFPTDVICERCSELFSTMDLTHDLCQQIAVDAPPEELQARLAELIETGV